MIQVPEVEKLLDAMPECNTGNVTKDLNTRARLRVVFNKRYRSRNPEQYAVYVREQNKHVPKTREFEAVNIPAHWDGI